MAAPLKIRIRKATGFAWALLALDVAIATFTIARMQPPPPRPASSPATEFSAERAWAAVEGLARLPRPIGSPAHAMAREGILNALRALGLHPRTQKALSAIEVPAFGVISGAWVENIIGRIPAPRAAPGAPAILLAAHYDSVRNSPGASDDAAGVATLLETARALLAPGQPALRHEVRLLFSDGEENALLGAHAFVDESPWARGVGLALNFEARGSGGPSAMYDASAAPGALVRALAGEPGITRFSANSFVPAVARALPNDTDFSVFRARGIPGLSFAYAGRMEHYHSAIDDALHLDLGSLQQHGEAALALARGLGQSGALPTSGEERVYFDLFGARILSYPAWVSITLAAALILLYGWRAGARGGLVSRQIGRDAAVYILALSSAGLALTGLAYLASAWRPLPLILHEAFALTLSYSAIAAGVFIAIFRHFRVRDSRGVWLVHLLAATLVAIGLPTAAHPLQWPLLAALIGTGASGIAAFFLSYVAYVFYIAVGSPLPVLIALPLLAYLALTWPRLVELAGIDRPAPPRPWPARFGGTVDRIGRAGGAAAICMIGGTLGLILTLSLAHYTPDFPEPSFVAYGSDRDKADENYWISTAQQKPTWLEPYRKAARPFREVAWFSPFLAPPGEEMLLAQAPASDLPAPELEVLESTPYLNGKRRARFRLRSTRGARCLVFWSEGLADTARSASDSVAIATAPGVPAAVQSRVGPDEAESRVGRDRDDAEPDVRVVSIDGHALHQYIRISPLADRWLGGLFLHANARADWLLNFCAAPPSGAAFEIETSARGKLRLRYQDKSEGLPTGEGFPAARPRPANLMPSSGSDVLVLSRSAEI